MPVDLRMYGIDPRRLARIPLAQATIEEVAGSYIDGIRHRQPHGPYLLADLCGGGVIAYEMAGQLVRVGKEWSFWLCSKLRSTRPGSDPASSRCSAEAA